MLIRTTAIFLLAALAACSSTPDRPAVATGERLLPSQEYNVVRDGAHLIVAFDPTSNSFDGTVVNKTDSVLRTLNIDVRVSTGAMLQPVKLTDLRPRQTTLIRVPGDVKAFDWWSVKTDTTTD